MPRFTIARWMAATAVLGLNIGLVRAFVIEDMTRRHVETLIFYFPISFALQFGLWRHLKTRGRRRRFWLGFEAAGLGTTMALTMLPDWDPILFRWYTRIFSDLCYYCLPRRVDAWLLDEHWDCFLVLIFFLPELVVALLGGMLGTCFFRKGDQADSPASQPMLQAPWKL